MSNKIAVGHDPGPDAVKGTIDLFQFSSKLAQPCMSPHVSFATAHIYIYIYIYKYLHILARFTGKRHFSLYSAREPLDSAKIVAGSVVKNCP